MGRTHSNIISVVLALSLATGCGDESSEPEGHALANGTLVRISATGSAELDLGGHPAGFALSDVAAPTVRTFSETFFGAMGIWEITRRDEVVETLDVYLGSNEADAGDDGIELRYEAGDGTRTGTVTIEPAGDEATRVRFEVSGDAGSLALPVRCDGAGTFHGFGEQYNATDQRGEAFQLWVTEQGIGRGGELRFITGDSHTTYFPMPYYVDARGFGVLVETSRRVDVDICATDDNVAWLEVISGEPLQLLVFHGPTSLDVIRQLGDQLGRPAAPPDWAYGLWVAAQGGPEAVLAEADLLEANDISAAALWVQDWTGHRRNADGGYGVQYRWAADSELYPDLAGLIDELHGRGYRFLAYANPFVDATLDDHFPEMDARGLLIGAPDDPGQSFVLPAPCGEASHPDLTNPETREYVKDALRAMVTDYGIDGWMADFAEYLPPDAVLADGSDPLAEHNRYPEAWQRLTREVMDELRPDGDWAMFARSGWTGVHAVAQIHWVGDQEASWSETDGLPTVVPAMLNLGLSGQPYVTHDIAGFSGGPSTKELYMRWVELGAFTPIMRTHDGNNRDDNWSWESDAETTAHFRRFARIHDLLAPELRALADAAQTTSAPIVRHLMLAFPDDSNTYPISDQYMLGDDLLVAPVTEEGAESRPVYLPAGTWFHVWTGERYEGGDVVDVAAPMGSPPVFSRGNDRDDLRSVE